MIYRFGLFEVNTEEFILRESGAEVSIEPRVFDVIVYLIQHHSRVVSRQELFEQIWLLTEVSDATLSNHIKIARAALGDNGQTQSVIKTLHGRGYQFVAPLEPRKQTPTQQDFSDPDLLPASVKPGLLARVMRLNKITATLLATIITLIATVLYLSFVLYVQSPAEAPVENFSAPELKSIAVFPFESYSALDVDLIFSNGIQKDLLTQISKISALKSISHSALVGHQGGAKSAQVIARSLGAVTVLTGGIQRSAGDVRINVQLVNVDTGDVVWAESYTRELIAENTLAIQREIASAIAVEVEAVLLAGKPDRLRRLPTQNLVAMEAYFRAGASKELHTQEGYREAIDQLSLAIKNDPNFALAHASLGELYVDQIYWSGENVNRQLSKARPHIERSLFLDGEIDESYIALGKFKSYEKDFSAADRAFRTAIELNPDSAAAYGAYGWFLLWDVAQVPLAIELLQKAKTLDPNNDVLGERLAQSLMRGGRFDEARNLLSDIVSRKPEFAAAYRTISDVEFFGDHRIADSMRSYFKNITLDPSVPTDALLVGWTYIHTGDRDQAISWLEYAVKLAPNSRDAQLTRALVHELKGNYSDAFDAYLMVPEESALFTEAMFYLMKNALKTGRIVEALAHYRQVSPELFNQEAVVDAGNMAGALALGRLLAATGDHVHSKYLFNACLAIAQVEVHGGWLGRHNNWEARIHIAMGNLAPALAVFKELVDSGYHSDLLISDSDYEPLHNFEEYRKLAQTMHARLEVERAELRAMEASGELSLPSAI